MSEVATGSSDVSAEPSGSTHRRRWLKWVVGTVAGVVVLVGVAVVVFVIATRDPEPGEFYDSPDDLSAPAGTILRSEPFTDGIPDGALAWKVLYVSTDEHDEPLAVSGLIIAPTNAGTGPHPVLAWSHGTTGIARACAPSNTDAPLAGIPDMTGPLEQGWVIALTDYPGLGTVGPHPYLVGQSEGRAVLDSVRATHALDIGVELDDRYAIWGHSQGGHAALFAGQLAEDHLPEYELSGVAALSPATRLQDNLAAIEGTEVGDVLTILAVESWSAYYPDIPEGTINSDAERPAERIAKSCINQPSRLRIAVAGLTLPDDIVAIDPTTDPTWTTRLAENSPDPVGVSAPLFVGQGLADELIVPEVTEAWAADRCTSTAPTTWRSYPDVNHTAVVGPGGTDALSWTIDRFDGRETTSECPATP
jgi:acetyl esterase/lipase